MVVFPDHTYYPVSAVWVFQLALPFLFSDFMLLHVNILLKGLEKKIIFLWLISSILYSTVFEYWALLGKYETVSDFTCEE